MHKSTARAEQFHSRSGNESTKPSRTGANLLGWGDDYLSSLSNEEQRDSLKRRLTYLMGLKNEGHTGKSIGLEMQEIHRRLGELRPRIKSERANEIPSLFMDICRERMTNPEFKLILDEANRRQRGGVTIEAVKRRLESK